MHLSQTQADGGLSGGPNVLYRSREGSRLYCEMRSRLCRLDNIYHKSSRGTDVAESLRGASASGPTQSAAIGH